MKILWACFHFIMFLLLAGIYIFSDIASVGKEICDIDKPTNDKREHYAGETKMIKIIILVMIITISLIVLYIVMKNQTAAAWFFGIAGIVYMYIALKHTIKMIFISEKRAFSFSDIQNFMYTYVIWLLVVLAVSLVESGDGKLDKLTSTYVEVVEVGLFLFWYYFNILYTLGGLYILLYYLRKVVNKLAAKFNFRGGKIENIANKVRDSWQQEEKYIELKSFRLWKENNRKNAVYKLLMTIPMLIFDICRIMYLFAKYCVRLTLVNVIKQFCDPIRVLYKFAKNLWNRHENNEWIYLFAQIAGPISYVIVFLIIQYGEYEEVTKSVYEFIGTIILIPYFLRKIENVNKNLKDNEAKVNVEGGKGEANLKNMVYNEIGEAAIDKKIN